MADPIKPRFVLGGVAYAKVRIDTPPDADGWCFCTPSNHPVDIARGFTGEEFNDRDQFFGQVFLAPPPEDKNHD